MSGQSRGRVSPFSSASECENTKELRSMGD